MIILTVEELIEAHSRLIQKTGGLNGIRDSVWGAGQLGAWGDLLGRKVDGGYLRSEWKSKKLIW